MVDARRVRAAEYVIVFMINLLVHIIVQYEIKAVKTSKGGFTERLYQARSQVHYRRKKT
jgi:hypothetical protein